MQILQKMLSHKIAHVTYVLNCNQITISLSKILPEFQYLGFLVPKYALFRKQIYFDITTTSICAHFAPLKMHKWPRLAWNGCFAIHHNQ